MVCVAVERSSRRRVQLTTNKRSFSDSTRAGSGRRFSARSSEARRDHRFRSAARGSHPARLERAASSRCQVVSKSLRTASRLGLELVGDSARRENTNNLTISPSPPGLDSHGQRQRGQFQLVTGARPLQLRGPAGDVHRSRAFRRHIRRGHRRERRARVDFRPAPAHAERAEHLHTQLGARRPAGDHQLRAVHVHRVHVPDVAVRADRVQSVGGGQRRVDRRVGVHADRPERGPVLRHREPAAQAAHVRRRPVRHAVHGDRGHGHLGGGRGLRRPGRPVLVRAAVPLAQRHAVRGVLPVPRGPGARLSQVRGARQVPRLLRRPAGRHRVLLRAHRPVPGAHHQQHAWRAPRPNASGPGPEKSGQDRAGVRADVRRLLPAPSRVHAVVLQLSQVHGGVQHVLARVANSRVLPELHQLVHQPDRPVRGQLHVPQALRPATVLVVRGPVVAVGGRAHRVQHVRRPEKRLRGREGHRLRDAAAAVRRAKRGRRAQEGGGENGRAADVAAESLKGSAPGKSVAAPRGKRDGARAPTGAIVPIVTVAAK